MGSCSPWQATASLMFLLTLDGGIEYQQNIASLPCAVVKIDAESNAIEHIQPLIAKILAVLELIPPKSFRYVR